MTIGHNIWQVPKIFRNFREVPFFQDMPLSGKDAFHFIAQADTNEHLSPGFDIFSYCFIIRNGVELFLLRTALSPLAPQKKIQKEI